MHRFTRALTTNLYQVQAGSQEIQIHILPKPKSAYSLYRRQQ